MQRPTHIKAVLRQQPEDEIRIVSVQSHDFASLIKFTEKIQALFPQLRGKRINICWQELSGDMITISSDDDLQFAYQERTRFPDFRICVKLDEHQKAPSTNVFNGEHPNIVCDSCDSSIYGFRYKCIECPDYDLCPKCESQGCHPEHCMLRLPYPTNSLPYLHHAVKRFSKILSRLKTKIYIAEFHEAKRGCSPTRNTSYRKMCPVIEKQTKIGCKSSRKNGEHSQEQKDKECDAAGNQTTQDQSVPFEHKKSNSKRGGNRSNGIEEWNRELFEHVLDVDKIVPALGVGARLFKAISGIDPSIFLSGVVYTDDEPGPPTSENPQERTESKEQPQPGTSGIDKETQNSNKKDPSPSNKNPQEPMETKKQPQQSTSQPSTSGIDNETQNSDKRSPSPLDKTGTGMNTTIDQSTREEKQQENVDNTENDQHKLRNGKEEHDEKDSKNEEVKKSDKTDEITPEWIIIDTNESSDNTSNASSVMEATSCNSNQLKSQASAPPMPKIYPELPEGAKMYHSNPKIQNAIETMIAMGFSNKGGLLTYLLDAEDGNISKVLDLLQPAQD